MRRVVLIAAMVLSLWPLGAIAAVALTGNGSDSTTQSERDSGSSSLSGHSAPGTDTARTSVTPAPEPNCAALSKLVAREHQLLTVLEQTHVSAGVAVPSLRQKATRLALEIGAWESRNDSLADHGLRVFVHARERLAVNMAAFADTPSQYSIGRLNKSITATNTANKELSLFCSG